MPLTGKGTAQGPSLRKGVSGTGGRLFAVLAFVSAALLTLSLRQGNSGALGMVRAGFQTITMPVRAVGALVGAPLTAVGNVASNLTADQETLSDLRAENEALRAENAQLAESAQMTERLEGLLQLRSTYSLRSTAALVISGATDSWTSAITIDKGTASGVEVGMPATDANSVIGQVIEASATTATVRLLSDENSSVSAMVQESRAQGALRGSADGTLRLTLVRADQTVSVGDTVVTSGLGGVFPKGLPLGRIVSVEKAAGALYYSVVVEPISSVEGFEEILVITSLTDEQQATAEDFAEADAQETAPAADAAAAAAESEGSADDGEG